ncbi:hypothetical protein ACFQDE_07160 [Deinococcus caeni]|uniref:Uncharacterized protein n=1 Tax=Deinococcus caeni TaxID=569127 RepID=A0ABP9U8C7_9DEIO
MRSTESTRFVPARSRSLLGLLTLGLLAGAPAFAQTTPPGAAPAETAPVTAPITGPTTEPAPPVPNLGLPATGTDQAAPPLPAEATPPDAAPTDPTSTDSSSDSSSTDAAPADAAPVQEPADAAPTVSSLPEPGSVKVPVLDGEEVLKTVPTVLGEALVYAGEAGDVMARTLAALKADGYAAAGESAAADRVLLSRDGQAFELSGRESFGVTVVSLSRVPGAAPTEASPTDETAPDETAPVEPPTDAPAEPDTDAPTDAAPTEPAPTEPAVPAPVTPGQP